MIKFINESVFNSNCDMIVNTINCHGVMDAGVALEFSLRYPEMYETYKKDCISGLIVPGKTYYYECKGQKILNFPTKGMEPRKPSQISIISDGLDFFAKHFSEYGAKSVAFPPLGCTNGKLNFESEVKPLMISKLSELPIDICICLNNAECSGLEKRMCNYIKCCNVDEIFSVLHFEWNTEPLKEKIKTLKYFNDIASSKYLKDPSMYRAIWNYIYKKVDGENYEI